MGALRRARDAAHALIPEEVLVGYHLCYGTFPEWPMYEARDYAVLVRMANFAVANSGRTVDWLHLAGPRYLRSEDRSFFRPLVDLEPATRACSWGSCFRSTASPGSDAGTRPPRATSTTSASRCTAASAASRARTAMETMREHRRVVRSLFELDTD